MILLHVFGQILSGAKFCSAMDTSDEVTQGILMLDQILLISKDIFA